MGRKRARSRKHFFLHLACLGAVLLNLDGCVTYPEKKEMESALSNAGRYLSGEDFQSALIENDRIRKSPDSLGTLALFQRGLIYAHPNNPDRDYSKAQDQFRKVLEQSPAGEPAGQAKVLIVLLARLMELENEKIALREKTGLLEKTVVRQKTKIEDQNKIVRRLDGDAKKDRTTIEELEQQLNTLKDQIEKLKNIDLQIENVKRQPAPPVKTLP
ncbi:MAG: hypothetical protein C4530_01125 [Desulfobacteraceae bacterium]|nr:MAG: hypothetical protein C4530_01125 [Desulfobacteraceae bacterium]